jgi:hypothetical protein
MLTTFEELQDYLRSETPLSNSTGDCVLCSERTFDRCPRCKKYFCGTHKGRNCITPRDVYANKIENS